jgi:hypothetical protein
MKSVHRRSAAFAAIALLALAGSVAAQERTNALLNTVEVQQLVARGDPADNARLSAHFAALADRYAAEARRHISMSRSFAGNPSRNFGAGMSEHCKRLANLNTESETTVRALAAYHETLASGAPATPPANAGRFQAGAGAPEPSEHELNVLAAKASTPAEHGALEEYFLTLANRRAAEASEHARLAQTYRGTRIAQAAVHHDHLAALSRDAATEARAAAAMHEGLIGRAR